MKARKTTTRTCRVYTDEIKQEAVQMLLDGHSPSAIVKLLGRPPANLLHNRREEQIRETGPVADSMDAKLREVQALLHRVERERDILKNALDILGRSD